MKKTIKTLLLMFIIILTLTSMVFASEDEYIVVNEYTYRNNKKTILDSKAYVEIMVGQGDFVSYQDDEYLTITPTPTKINEDEFGNKYAYFSLEGLLPNQRFVVTVKRRVKVSTYEETIPSRANTDLSFKNALYLNPQSNIDSKNEKIITKAKELTVGNTSDYKKAQAIFEYINVNLTYDDSSAYSGKGSLSALETMRGVCEDYATLFVAMCRAVDIPSRVVTGYYLKNLDEVNTQSGDEIKSIKFENHAWAEIYLQDYGWVPVDPTVFYNSNATAKIACLDAFCKLKELDHVATGLYYRENADRVMAYVTEIDLTEKITKISDDAEKVKKNNFKDISNYEWAKDAIDYLYGIDVIKGYSETEFGPQNNISRIEFIAMLARALRYQDTAYEKKGLVYYFLDYDTSHWSKDDYDYLMRCYQALSPSDIASAGYNTIADVFTGGRLDMNKPITRGEVVALMDIFLMNNDSPTYFTDIEGNRFKNSITKAFNAKLVNGYPDNSFKPNNNITRAEIAVILERYVGSETFNIL